MKKLRDYQAKAIDCAFTDLKDYNRAIITLNPGMGKTVIFSHITMLGLKHKRKVLIILNQVQLLKQAENELKECINNDDIGIFCGTLNKKEIRPATLALVQSIKASQEKSIEDFILEFDLVIIDEVHLFYNFLKYIDQSNLISNKSFLGVTATPFTSKKFLYGEKEFFRRLSYEMPYGEAVRKGYLVNLVIGTAANSFETKNLKTNTEGDFTQKSLNYLVIDEEKKIELQVDDAINRIRDRNKCLWIAINIEHANKISKLIDGCLWHSGKNDLELFKKSDKERHLVTVNMAIAGFNFPKMDALILMRPTKSPVVLKQSVGRILRPSPGKKDALFLGYSQSIVDLGHPLKCKPIVKEKKKKSSLKKINNDKYHWSYSVLKMQSTAIDYKELEPRWVKITSIEKKLHRSKANKLCVKITYFFNNLKIADSYFNSYHVKYSFGKRNFEDFMESYHCPGKIKIVREGQFIKVLEVGR